MVTKQDCLTGRYFRYLQGTYSRSKELKQVRASGKCQTWKTRPDDFKLPVKYGMYESLYITPDNAALFITEDEYQSRKEQAQAVGQVLKNPAGRKRYYVGHSGTAMTGEVFLSQFTPTADSHGSRFKAVTGPFRTKRAAELMAAPHGPQIQHVSDAERYARARKNPAGRKYAIVTQQMDLYGDEHGDEHILFEMLTNIDAHKRAKHLRDKEFKKYPEGYSTQDTRNTYNIRVATGYENAGRLAQSWTVIEQDARKNPRSGVGYQPKTGAACFCKPGIQRDNCPRCEGTGQQIDFAKIRNTPLSQSQMLAKARKNPSDVLSGKSIQTEYFGPGNTRGARIKASVIDGNRIQSSISISYPHELDSYAAHIFAAEKMRDKMGWTGDLIGVGTRKGYVFGFKDFSTRARKNPGTLRATRKSARKLHPRTHYDTSGTKSSYLYVQKKDGAMWLSIAAVKDSAKGRIVAQRWAQRYHRQHPGSTLRLFV